MLRRTFLKLAALAGPFISGCFLLPVPAPEKAWRTDSGEAWVDDLGREWSS